VNAHTYLSSVTVDGVQQTNCLRPLGTNSPISSVTSPDMTCGFLPKGAAPAAGKCTISAGDTIGLQWNHGSPSPNDDIIDGSHKGPCLVYLSKDNGTSWFKIYENGYNETTQQFCVTWLINKKGYMEATIPYDISPGNYLIRAEIIALHQAENLGGAQPYVDCAELAITSNGTVNPSGIPIPGAYSPTDPGILFNIYASPMAKYVIPGPPLYTPSASGSGSGSGFGSGTGSGAQSGAGTGTGNTTQKSDSGMSTSGKVVLSLFLVGFVGGIVAAAVFYQRKGHLFGYTLSGNKNSQPSDSNYIAYVDELEL